MFVIYGIISIIIASTKAMSTIQFKNASIYPIIVSSWITRMEGLSEFIDVYVPPNTEVKVISNVGEWMIGSLFASEYCEEWRAANLPFESVLAKFRNKPCAMGDFTWNYYDNLFDLKYEDGTIIWSTK